MRRVHLEGIGGVVAVHGKRRHQQRAVNTDGVHGSHHVVTCDVWRAGENGGPGAARVVAFVGVHLSIYGHHDRTSHE
jgi:hypothetical protein